MIPPLPKRSHALHLLSQFVEQGALAYARDRNFDWGPGRRENVSNLSPFLRQRLITEHEVISTLLRTHPFAAVEKFVQEVFWRTYWKGWLEQRPSVWTDWLQRVEADRASLSTRQEACLRAAEAGETGIDCFDTWTHELKNCHTLHNHTRMWFASIWIFTLDLPWSLGADFFLRHLLDGDPASNTLSWRWVAGLQTRGKHYVARAANIDRFTDGAHKPYGSLNECPEALQEDGNHPLQPLQFDREGLADSPWLLVLHNDDLSPALLPNVKAHPPAGIIALAPWLENPGYPDPEVLEFHSASVRNAAREEAISLSGDPQHPLPVLEVSRIPDPDTWRTWAKETGASSIVSLHAPVGFQASALNRLRKACPLPWKTLWRDWDRKIWPAAQRGFFPFKETIPRWIASLGISNG